MIKKFKQFFEEVDNNISSDNKYEDIIKEIKKMIKNTIENNGGEFKTFLESYIKNTEDVKIEGFINDSDIYDFFLKWRNDIDEILNELNYFDETPTKLNVYTLYEYTIKGTERAFLEIAKKIK